MLNHALHIENGAAFDAGCGGGRLLLSERFQVQVISVYPFIEQEKDNEGWDYAEHSPLRSQPEAHEQYPRSGHQPSDHQQEQKIP